MLTSILIQSSGTTQNGFPMFIFDMLFNLSSKLFLQKSMLEYLNYFELYKKFLKYFLLNIPDTHETFSLLSTVTSKNNLCCVIYDFIAFSLQNHTKICIERLNTSVPFQPYQTLEFSKQDLFYELNVFTQQVLSLVFDIIETLFWHIRSNNLDFIHYDRSLSCCMWYLIEYISVSESIISLERVNFIHDFNLKLYINIFNLLNKYSQHSVRFNRQIKFLIFGHKCLITNYLQHIKNDHKFILNLKNVMQDAEKSMADSVNVVDTSNLDKELVDVLNSIDLFYVDTVKFMLMHIKSILIYEFKSIKCLSRNSLKVSTLNLMLEKFSLIKEKCKFESSEYAEEINCLLFYCSSFIGPNKSKTKDNDCVFWKRELFFIEKFDQELDGENFIFKFYLDLFKSLFEFLFNRK